METTHTQTGQKTLQNFFDQCSNPYLFKKVWTQSGLRFSDVKRYPNDFRDPSSGSVPGFIYYSDTEKFAKNNMVCILQLVADFDKETGSNTLVRAYETGNPLNFLAWFAYESFIIELIDFLES